MVSVLVLTGVVIGAPTISPRSGIGRRNGYRRVVRRDGYRRELLGRRDTYRRVVVKSHTCDDIDPYELANMSILLAFEFTQAAWQSCCLNDVACQNM